MNPPNEIEKALKRLMPSPLSEQGNKNILLMIENLAEQNMGTATPQLSSEFIVSPSKIKTPLAIWKFATAAAVILLASASIGVFSRSHHPHTQNQLARNTVNVESDADSLSDAVLIDRLSVLNHQESPRLIRNRDGSVIEEVNRKIVTRERYRTGKNGYLMTISESRAEKVFVPKNSF